ncbi:MAG: PAS domain-containing sensor histidine kinase [Desulfobacteraceae bacterium]|nr:MAG: PAS domain-containing sensor histidine kinase [Desulfobacteraceae bacterium]
MPEKPTYEDGVNQCKALEAENSRLRQETIHLKLFKSAVEAASDAIGMATAEGYHWYQNNAFDELFGDIGSNPTATLYVDEKVGIDVFRTIMAGREWIGDVLMHGRSGGILDIHLRAYPFKDKNGKVLGLVGVHTDITRQKKVESALLESESRLKKAQAVAKIGSWEYDFSTNEIWGSKEAASILGIEGRESVLPLSRVENLIVESGKVQQNLHKILEKNRAYDLTFKARRENDGEEIWIHLTAEGIKDKGESFKVIGILQDVTDQQRTAGALRESRERLHAIFEATPDPIVVYNREGHPEFINLAFQEVFGWTFDELQGKIIPFVPEDQKTVSIREIEKLYQTEIPARFETRRLTKSGKILDVLISASVIKGIKGEHAGMVVNISDMTERKKQAAQFRQAQKMEAIGTLAGGIAHDFNNILSAVMGYSELALYKAKDGKPNRKELEKVLKAAERATDLVQQILNFSRQAEKKISAVHIKPIIREALKLMRASLPATIEIRQEMDGSFGKINADATQIHQIIMNLCVNAGHAMGDSGGILRVSLQEMDHIDAGTSSFSELTPGRYQKISVSDTGHGIPKADMERIFDPFFTTKEKGKGTGMGLAVVHGIVQSYGGAISVDSEPGKGSTFNIFLPVDASIPLLNADQEKGIPLPTGNENILLIDDEETLVDIGRRMIERLGYQVTAFQSGTAALEAFRARPNQFDLVITDQTMPKITGAQLAHEMLCIRPTLPIILCTGYSAQISDEMIKKIGIKRMIMKPFLAKDVAVAIRELLDGIPDIV